MRTNRGLVTVLALAALVSCRPEDQRTDSIDLEEAMQERADLAPAVAAHLDSGSVLFRADDHEAALEHYRMAVEIDPDAAAAWFGVYMAETALGNVEAATEALERAQREVPGATLIHPTDADTVR
jgi:tetratricopeptide (TPR) repeat protein